METRERERERAGRREKQTSKCKDEKADRGSGAHKSEEGIGARESSSKQQAAGAWAWAWAWAHLEESVEVFFMKLAQLAHRLSLRQRGKGHRASKCRAICLQQTLLQGDVPGTYLACP